MHVGIPSLCQASTYGGRGGGGAQGAQASPSSPDLLYLDTSEECRLPPMAMAILVYSYSLAKTRVYS